MIYNLTDPQPVARAALFATLPPEWPDDPIPAIVAIRDAAKVVVLDDDPTGTQTVHSIPVLTEWSVEALRDELTMVLGQLLPGVPVWRLGPESRFPDLMYIVFPGNVGGPEAIVETVNRLSR